MKFQFSTKAILLATAAVAIALGGVIAWEPDRTWWPSLGVSFAFNAPLWFPLIFAAFALGRKKLTLAMVLIFAIAEATGVGLVYWLRSTV